LDDYPDLEPEPEDEELVQLMSMAQEMVTLGHAARNKAGIKVRQPLEGAVFKGWSRREQDEWAMVEPIIRDELNLKSIRLAEEGEELAELTVKPNFAKLGPKLGPNVKQLVEQLQAQREEALKAFVAGQTWHTALAGEDVDILVEDVTIEKRSPEGLLHLTDDELEISLKIEISDVLAREGAARDIVRRLQNLRKDSGLEVSDRIVVYLSRFPGIEKLLEEQGEYIREEVLGTEMVVSEPPDGAISTTCQVGESEVTLSLEKTTVNICQ